MLHTTESYTYIGDKIQKLSKQQYFSDVNKNTAWRKKFECPNRTDLHDFAVYESASWRIPVRKKMHSIFGHNTGVKTLNLTYFLDLYLRCCNFFKSC